MNRINTLRGVIARMPNIRRTLSSVTALKEPNEPRVVTQQIPGPQAVSLKEQLGKLQQSSGVMLFVDYEKSVGKGEDLCSLAPLSPDSFRQETIYVMLMAMCFSMFTPKFLPFHSDITILLLSPLQVTLKI